MDYFIALTPGDLPLADVAERSCVLASPAHFPLGRASIFGRRRLRALMLDSGAYHHNSSRRGRTQQEALDDQLRVVHRFPEADQVFLVHCDVLPRLNISYASAVQQTLRNAEAFQRLEIDGAFERVAVAQGRSPDEMYLVVSALREMGYERVAIGGLANLYKGRHRAIGEYIEAACEAADTTPVHVLGVTAPKALFYMRRSGVVSCDSASPIWAAVHGLLLYSRPFRRFRLSSRRSLRAESDVDTGFHSMIERPLPCQCPVCQRDPELLTGTDTRGKHFRTIHNYLHLRAEVEGAHIWRQVSLSADYLFDFVN